LTCQLRCDAAELRHGRVGISALRDLTHICLPAISGR
jgi:hypothetical protein